jgi:predicted phosphodiesterase
MHNKIALFGGVYSNYIALEETIKDALRKSVDEIYCLGDLGAFGPNPDNVFPILKQHKIKVVQGNYDHSIGNNLDDCQCGYTDPRDNYYAKLSYDYTYQYTNEENKRWLKDLPAEIRLEINDYKILLCHGSPRQTNEFLWETTTPTHFLEKLCSDYDADVICATHTGIHWDRRLSGNKYFVNAGVIGRPENDGRTEVGYSILDFNNKEINIEFIPISYDYKSLAQEMREVDLPEEFVETILTGWWTTCLEILPMKERIRGKF